MAAGKSDRFSDSTNPNQEEQQQRRQQQWQRHTHEKNAEWKMCVVRNSSEMVGTQRTPYPTCVHCTRAR